MGKSGLTLEFVFDSIPFCGGRERARSASSDEAAAGRRCSRSGVAHPQPAAASKPTIWILTLKLPTHCTVLE